MGSEKEKPKVCTNAKIDFLAGLGGSFGWKLRKKGDNMFSNNNTESCINLRLGKIVEEIELESFQHLILDVALKNHKDKFSERDYLYLYLGIDRMGICIDIKSQKNNSENLIVEEKIGAFYSSSDGGRRAFYGYLLTKARGIKQKSKDVNS